MLINLSNHPYSNWQVTQKSVAVKYGECIDLPFPDVDPFGGEEYIQNLARLVVGEMEPLFEGEDITVHVMGEMTLMYAIIGLLHQKNIRCIASTTKRIVEEKSNGRKEVIFEFIRFREYQKCIKF